MLKPIDLFFLIGLTVVCTGALVGAIEAGLIQPKSVESYAGDFPVCFLIYSTFCSRK
jgi:hypothetical protein